LIDVKHGFAFQGEFIHDEPCGDILLTPGNFSIRGGFKGDKFKYYDGPVPDEFVLAEGDLLVTMTDLSKQADTLGFPAFVPSRPDGRRYLHNQRLGKVQLKDANAVDTRYLHYLLCTADYRHEVLASATGTTVKHTSPERIRRFRFLRPPLSEQRAIAQVLGTLDDKIELNRRMSETLEAIARALFKSWFVDFNPVRAKAEGRDPGLPKALADLFPDRLVDSELGEVPEGWDVGTLGDVADHPRRGVRVREIEAGTPYIALEHMPKRCIALTDWSSSDGVESSKFEFRCGEILFGKLRPYFHKVGVAPLNGVCSTDIVVVAPRVPKWFGFVLGHTTSDEFVVYTDAGSTGTKMPRTSWDEMARYVVALPPEPLAGAFTEVVQPAINRIVLAVHESRALGALRDAVLPKLVSGEIRAHSSVRYAAEVPQAPARERDPAPEPR
jgi:type I restriction enzyme S subunit